MALLEVVTQKRSLFDENWGKESDIGITIDAVVKGSKQFRQESPLSGKVKGEDGKTGGLQKDGIFSDGKLRKNSSAGSLSKFDGTVEEVGPSKESLNNLQESTSLRKEQMGNKKSLVGSLSGSNFETTKDIGPSKKFSEGSFQSLGKITSPIKLADNPDTPDSTALSTNRKIDAHEVARLGKSGSDTENFGGGSRAKTRDTQGGSQAQKAVSLGGSVARGILPTEARHENRSKRIHERTRDILARLKADNLLQTSSPTTEREYATGTEDDHGERGNVNERWEKLVQEAKLFKEQPHGDRNITLQKGNVSLSSSPLDQATPPSRNGRETTPPLSQTVKDAQPPPSTSASLTSQSITDDAKELLSYNRSELQSMILQQQEELKILKEHMEKSLNDT